MSVTHGLQDAVEGVYITSYAPCVPLSSYSNQSGDAIQVDGITCVACLSDRLPLSQNLRANH
jgi:hypothetical protein